MIVRVIYYIVIELYTLYTYIMNKVSIIVLQINKNSNHIKLKSHQIQIYNSYNVLVYNSYNYTNRFELVCGEGQ